MNTEFIKQSQKPYLMKAFIENVADALKVFSPIILLMFICICYLVSPVEKTKAGEDLTEQIKQRAADVPEKSGVKNITSGILYPSPMNGLH
jgi:hypothetical protein